MGNIKLRHYSTKLIPDNWMVFIHGKYVGDVHNCDGIGGWIGEYTETEMFNEVCDMAREALKSREKVLLLSVGEKYAYTK